MSAREVLEELDRLGISIFYRPQAPGLGMTLSVGLGRERAYPELRRAIEERTPELLRLASFEASRSECAARCGRIRGASVEVGT